MRISDWSSDVCSSDLADAALRASEERLRLAQELGGVGSFDWDLATGKAEITESCRHVCGLPPDLVMTRQIFETLVHPDDVHRVRERSEEHTSELQSLMRMSFAVFCLKKKHKTE